MEVGKYCKMITTEEISKVYEYEHHKLNHQKNKRQ